MLPAHRAAGVGRALLAAVAARVRERGGERLEWCALDWTSSPSASTAASARSTMDQWITHRLDGEALERMADEGAGRSPGERR